MPQNFNGYLLALFAIFFWSFNVIYSKYLANTFSPFEISFIRWIIPTLLFVPFSYKSIVKYRRELAKAFPTLFLLAFTGIGFLNTFVYFAGHTSNAVDMALIGATGPVFLLIFAGLFLHRKITLYQVLGIICALLGVTTVILDGNFLNLNEITLTIGDFWMLCAAITFAIYAIAQKKLPANIPQMTSLSVMILLASLIFLPLAAYDFTDKTPENITKTDILILLILGIFNSGLAYFAWNKAIFLIGTIKTGTIYYLMPIFSAIEAHFFLGEQIFLNQVYGAILVLVGIVISNIQPKSAMHRQQKTRRHKKQSL